MTEPLGETYAALASVVTDLGPAEPSPEEQADLAGAGVPVFS